MTLQHRSWKVFAIVAVILSLVAIMSLPTTAQEEATVEEILENPDTFVGQTVTVSGTVTVILDEPQAFTLEGEEQPVGDDALLVLTEAGALPEDFDDGMTAMVTGEVQIVDPNDPTVFEDLGLDPSVEAFAQFQDDPVIVAETVEVAGAQATPAATEEATPAATPEATPEETPEATPTEEGTPEAAATASPTASPTQAATATPAPSPTPTPGQVAPVTGGGGESGSAILFITIVAVGLMAAGGGLLLRRAAR